MKAQRAARIRSALPDLSYIDHAAPFSRNPIPRGALTPRGPRITDTPPVSAWFRLKAAIAKADAEIAAEAA